MGEGINPSLTLTDITVTLSQLKGHTRNRRDNAFAENIPIKRLQHSKLTKDKGTDNQSNKVAYITLLQQRDTWFHFIHAYCTVHNKHNEVGDNINLHVFFWWYQLGCGCSSCSRKGRQHSGVKYAALLVPWTGSVEVLTCWCTHFLNLRHR